MRSCISLNDSPLGAPGEGREPLSSPQSEVALEQTFIDDGTQPQRLRDGSGRFSGSFEWRHVQGGWFASEFLQAFGEGRRLFDPAIGKMQARGAARQNRTSCCGGAVSNKEDGGR
jgi:hypothetical protein